MRSRRTPYNLLKFGSRRCIASISFFRANASRRHSFSRQSRGPSTPANHSRASDLPALRMTEGGGKLLKANLPAAHNRMLTELRIVMIGEVSAIVCAAAFFACQRRTSD
jgi:hypothetical protein